MPTGYCTVPDVRRALQETIANFESGAWGENNHQVVVDAITAQTEPLEKELKRHWYEPGGITEDDLDLIPTAVKTRDDEEDIPTRAFLTTGSSERSSYYPPAWVDYDPDADADPDYAEMDGLTPKTVQGDYAAIPLPRRDADTISALHVRTEDGTFEDWAGSNDYTEGSWPPSGEDYYLRVNNGGWSRVYIDTTNLLKEDEDDEYVLESFANAVYIEYSYGHEGIPRNVRRAVAFRAAAELLLDDEAALGIPDNGQLVNPESKKQAMENKADELLEVYR
jgi:hypothetical protein